MNRNNINKNDIWKILVEEGVDKLIGITEDEFNLIEELNSSNSSITNEELCSILSAYRTYKKYRNKPNDMVKSS